MLSRRDFIRDSLEINLFFLRIMKEHLTLVAAALSLKDNNMIGPLMDLVNNYDKLLMSTISMASGNISPQSMLAGDIITPYTLDAELVTQNLSGLPINIEITRLEANLANKPYANNMVNEQTVYSLNQQIIVLLRMTIETQKSLLNDVLSCNKFVFLPALMLDHDTREAEHYLQNLEALQKGESLMENAREIAMHTGFWDNIMGEHAMFMRDLLDPTERELKRKANGFAMEFEELTEAARRAINQLETLAGVTNRSLNSTINLRNFKEQATIGILDCRIRSMILPLLSDHILREANHFIKSLHMIK